MSRLQLERDVGGSLVLYPELGRADGAATLNIYDFAGALLVGPVAVALGAATQALAESALIASDLVTVSSAAAFAIRRPYWLTNEEDSGIEVKIIGKKSFAINTGLRLDQPLPWAAASASSTIADHGLAYTVDVSLAATLRRRIKARWQYAIDGVAMRETQLFDVVAEPFDISVTEEQIESVFPEFGERRGAREGWRKLLKGASDKLFSDLETRGILPELIWGHDLLELALIYRVLFLFYFLNADRRELFSAEYDLAFAAILAAGQWPSLQGAA